MRSHGGRASLNEIVWRLLDPTVFFAFACPAGSHVNGAKRPGLAPARLLARFVIQHGGMLAEDAVVLHSFDAGRARAGDCIVVNYFVLQPEVRNLQPDDVIDDGRDVF